MTAYMFDYQDFKDMMKGFGICFLSIWGGISLAFILDVGGLL